MNQPVENVSLRKRGEPVLMARLQVDIEIALAFLRLADAECKSGNHSRASQLIDKATLAYQAAMQHLDHPSADSEKEISALRQGARELFEAIHVAEFRQAASRG